MIVNVEALRRSEQTSSAQTRRDPHRLSERNSNSFVGVEISTERGGGRGDVFRMSLNT